MRVSNNKNAIWAINSMTCSGAAAFSKRLFKTLLENVKTNKTYIMFLSPKSSGGKIVGFGEVQSISQRELGELISISATNEENGWHVDGEWDYEITFTNEFYDTTNLPEEFLGLAKLKDFQHISQSSLTYANQNLATYLLHTINIVIMCFNKSIRMNN